MKKKLWPNFISVTKKNCFSAQNSWDRRKIREKNKSKSSACVHKSEKKNIARNFSNGKSYQRMRKNSDKQKQ